MEKIDGKHFEILIFHYLQEPELNVVVVTNISIFWGKNKLFIIGTILLNFLCSQRKPNVL